MNDNNKIIQEIEEQSHYQSHSKNVNRAFRSNQRPRESESKYRGYSKDQIYRTNNDKINKL